MSMDKLYIPWENSRFITKLITEDVAVTRGQKEKLTMKTDKPNQTKKLKRNKLCIMYTNGKKYHTPTLQGKPELSYTVTYTTLDKTTGIKTTHVVPTEDIASVMYWEDNGDVRIKLYDSQVYVDSDLMRMKG